VATDWSRWKRTLSPTVTSTFATRRVAIAEAVWYRQSSSTNAGTRDASDLRSWSWEGFWKRVTIPWILVRGNFKLTLLDSRDSRDWSCWPLWRFLQPTSRRRFGSRQPSRYGQAWAITPINPDNISSILAIQKEAPTCSTTSLLIKSSLGSTSLSSTRVSIYSRSPLVWNQYLTGKFEEEGDY